eukprot:10295820-Karenia_brevis.AAC.1
MPQRYVGFMKTVHLLVASVYVSAWHQQRFFTSDTCMCPWHEHEDPYGRIDDIREAGPMVQIPSQATEMRVADGSLQMSKDHKPDMMVKSQKGNA